MSCGRITNLTICARQSQNFIPDRLRLRSDNGGAAYRPLAYRQIFLNSMYNIVPRLIKLKGVSDTDAVILGLLPSFSSILGAG